MAQLILRTEDRINPLGLDAVSPRFSWILEGEDVGRRQTAYQIVAWDAYGHCVWDTDKVETDESRLVPYKGMALLPRSRYTWQVTVWDENGTAVESEEASFETGLMHARGFLGEWIAPEAEQPEESVWRLHRDFTLESVPNRARAYVTAHGIYHLFVNGQRVGEDEFTPGWTSYEKRLQYQTYDITPYLKAGENCIAAELAEGWYRGNLGWTGHRDIYGDKLEFLGRFVMDGLDLQTDGEWKSAQAPYAFAGFYRGVSFDATKDDPEWNLPGKDDSSWQGVATRPVVEAGIIAQENHAPKRREVFKPLEIITTPKGERVIDFGQNLVGWVELKLSAKTGDWVEISHAEVLDKEGNFYTANYRTAEAKLHYVCRGGEEESFRPDFSYYGFRYIRLDAFPDADPMTSLQAVAVYSDMEETAGFETNDADVNQLFHNILWGQKGNFLEVPTDCPQRDERLGWTGDIQVFSRTAATLMDSKLFLEKWLRDLAADQAPDGAVPHVIPDVLKGDSKASAAWADAAVIVPWNLYQVYGDKSVLEAQYPSMKAWVEYIRANSDEGLLWTKGTHYGDWLGLDVPFGTYKGATDEDYIATAYYAHSTDLLAQTAEILGYKEESKDYAKLHKEILKAFRHEFVTKSGRLAVKTQTACLLALAFDLVKKEHRARTLAMLVNLIEKAGVSLTTGFVGTPLLCRTLSENGRHDLAVKLFLKRDYPSWLYPISKGATTMWEHWDGIRPDGTFWSVNMNSYNHYAYGCIAEWMFRNLAGLDSDPKYPGYRRIRFAPMPCEGLERVEAWVRTPHGRAACGWKRDDDEITVKVVVPWNTTAELTLPVKRNRVVDAQNALLIPNGDKTRVLLGAGEFSFTYKE